MYKIKHRISRINGCKISAVSCSTINTANPSLSARIVQSAICRTNSPFVQRPFPTIFYYPGLYSKPIWKLDTNSDNNRYNNIISELESKLNSSKDRIVSEYSLLRKSTNDKSDYNLSESNNKGSKGEHKLHAGSWDWNSYVLKGKRQSEFAVHCPVTVDTLESFQHCKLMTQTPFSFAFFSTLHGQSSIAAHYGPCNIRLRCHFPLILPQNNDDFGMKIGSNSVKWEENKLLLFDDCYEHQVWNHTQEDRVVLLFDIWHPDLHNDEIDAITDMFDEAKQKGWLK
eukprot:gene5067-7071_t